MFKCVYDSSPVVEFHKFKDRNNIKMRLYICSECGAIWEHNLETNHITRKTRIAR